jgi:penicillin-binding protein 1A
MAASYAVIANGGYLVDPYFIERIAGDGDEVLYEATPARACRDCEPAEMTPVSASGDDGADPAPMAARVIDERNRYLMYSMMQDVVQSGTATRARALGRKDIAGKTGTTNDQRDAWFNGFNEQIVANAWVGFDDNSKLGRGEVGGRAALPAWLDYMRVALEGLPDREPTMPEGIVTVRIDPRTGARATAATDGALFEVFRSEYAPGETLAAGGSAPAVVTPPPTQELF